MKVIAVLGISGVSKSTLVEKAAEHRGLLHLKASDLIKARMAQSSEQLRQGAVLDNQALMLAKFSERAATTNHDTIVFGGHSLIDTPNGLLDIPLSVFEAIKPDAIVFVEDAPDTIAARRTMDISRVRPARSGVELVQHQSLAKVRAAFFAQSLDVPLHTIAPDDVAELLAVFT